MTMPSSSTSWRGSARAAQRSRRGCHPGREGSGSRARRSGTFSDHLAYVLTAARCPCTAVPDDQKRAAELAERAVDQLHQWDGPTRQALLTLPAGTDAGRVAVEGAGPDPAARRTGARPGREAARPEVIIAAAAAALALRRAELADALVNSLLDGIDKQFAVLRRDAPSGNPESDRARWAALLDVLDETRPEQLVRAVMQLADLGEDRSPRLDVLVETSVISPDVQALAQATAAAVRDLPSGLRNSASFPTRTIWRRPR